MDMDLISRKAAIDALCDDCPRLQSVCPHYPCREFLKIEELPSVQIEVTEEAVLDYCRKRCLVILTYDCFHKLTTVFSKKE